MAKKILCVVLLVISFVFAFTSCGDDNNETTNTPEPPAHTHSFGEWETTKAATCTAEGSKERYCPCGEKQTATISMAEHSYGEWTVVKPATTTETGSEERSCSCGKKETRDIDMLPVVTTVTEEQWKNAFDLSKYVSFTVTGSESGSEDGVDFDFDATIKYYGGLIYIKLDGTGYHGENDFVKYESTAIESFYDLYVEGFGNLQGIIRDFEELNDFGYSSVTYSTDTKAYTTVDERGRIYRLGFEDGKLVKFSYEDNGQEEFLFAEYTFSDINTTQKTDMPLAVIIAEYNEIVNAISSSDKFYYYDEENWTRVYYDTAELKEILSNVRITNVEEYEKGSYENCFDWYVETYSGSSSNPSIRLEVREGEIHELSINSQYIYVE